MSKWIKLSDQKPSTDPDKCMVMVYRCNDDPNLYEGWPDLIDIAWYWGDNPNHPDIQFTIGNDVGQPWDPTHWYPLPPFPKDDK